MSVRKILIILMMLAISASQFFMPIAHAGTSEDLAASALARAEESLFSACQAVAKAAEAGGNVSSLLIRLNEAGWFLAHAQVTYGSGDFDSTLEFAAQSQKKLNGVVADADVLREKSIQANYADFMINIVGSIIGSIGTVCVGFSVWLLFKRKYEKAGGTV